MVYCCDLLMLVAVLLAVPAWRKTSAVVAWLPVQPTTSITRRSHLNLSHQLRRLLIQSHHPNSNNPDFSFSVRGMVASDTGSSSTIVDRSTLTLLEHVNLNVPSQEHVVPFYFGLLGCGLDPRKAANLAQNSPKRTLWANCGRGSQFHLPYGDPAQRIPGHIGLRFDSLEGLTARLEEFRACYDSAERGEDPSTGRSFIRITDHYGNVFVCRAKQDGGASKEFRQPYIRPSETEQWGEFATKYGKMDTECWIDYVEFYCPKGAASKIAEFYESVLDATTYSFEIGDGLSIAIIAVGNVDELGRADQSILFRETTEQIPDYDGHHIALYVGESGADFEQAFKNAQLANVVWCNPRFQDQADSLEEARKEQQFRFKDIVDMETGERIMELEHEMRSINHPAWPGKTKE